MINDLPLNQRFPGNRLWHHTATRGDFDRIAASLIPAQHHVDDYWIGAARTVLASTAYQMRHDPDKSVTALLHLLFSDDHNALTTCLQGTDASRLVDPHMTQPGMTLRRVLSTYLNALPVTNHATTVGETYHA